MNQYLEVDLGPMAQHLPSQSMTTQPTATVKINSTKIKLQGLLIPEGITLICGGGYHGKSTLLQSLAAGIYNKIPGDGREYCVALNDAVSVRAEDGRYVNHCNISAFIANLPSPKAMKTETASTTNNDDDDDDVPHIQEKDISKTVQFSTKDSSGSTSQASNVSEAIEMGAKALLIDEDVSAANFMARDGRMRALVMDESITPLLYRVNGLFQSKHKVSSIVVVGGVGDWLDVPHQVLLLDHYVASDATQKAASISYQFSYNHVQYGGKGVVHRLEWEFSGSPIPRKPSPAICQYYTNTSAHNTTEVSLLEGGHGLGLYPPAVADENHIPALECLDDDEFGTIDASRLEQLLLSTGATGNSGSSHTLQTQLLACGMGVLWILQTSPKNPTWGIRDLLEAMDKRLDQGGLIGLVEDLEPPTSHQDATTLPENSYWTQVVQQVGFLQRPRKYEVGQTLTRLFGIELEQLPVEEDETERQAKEEAERKKQALLAIWAQRRRKGRNQEEKET